MASACLPMLFQAVEIDGEAYWDGGYMGNPALFPLFYEAHCDDILLVQINPIQRKELPTKARAIQDRLNEITFNASLLRELRAIDFVNRLVDAGKLPTDEYKRVLMHRIDGGPPLALLTSLLAAELGMEFPAAPARHRPRGGEALAEAELRGDRRGRNARPQGGDLVEIRPEYRPPARKERAFPPRCHLQSPTEGKDPCP